MTKPIKLPEDFITQVSDTIKLLGHAQRLRILEFLDLNGESSVSAITKGIDGQQPAVSQHLNKMRISNVIAARREGKQMYYCIASESATTILSCMRKQYHTKSFSQETC